MLILLHQSEIFFLEYIIFWKKNAKNELMGISIETKDPFRKICDKQAMLPNYSGC